MKPQGISHNQLLQGQELPNDILGLASYGFRVNWWIVGCSLFLIILGLLGFWLYKKYKGVRKEIKQKVSDPFLETIEKIKKLSPQQPYHRKNQEQIYLELGLYLRLAVE